MPIEVGCTHEGAGIIYLGSDIITGDDLLQADESADQFDVKKIKFYLLDYTRTMSTTVSVDGLRHSVGEEAAKVNPNIVVAIAASEDVIFGLSRMYGAFTDELPWKVFVTRRLDEAKNWIKDQTGLEVI